MSDNLPLEQLEELQKDRYINTQFSLWNALIVLNGLNIGAITILYLVNSNTHKSLTFFIFFFSSLAILLLIMNYFKTRRVYFELNTIEPSQIGKLKEEEYQKNLGDGIQKAKNRNKWIKRRETVALGLTFSVLVLFLSAIAIN